MARHYVAGLGNIGANGRIGNLNRRRARPAGAGQELWRCVRAATQRAAGESYRLIITPDGWKLSLSDLDCCRLFTRREDPGEQRSLHYRGGHQAMIARQTKEIHAWQERSGDRLALRLGNVQSTVGELARALKERPQRAAYGRHQLVLTSGSMFAADCTGSAE